MRLFFAVAPPPQIRERIFEWAQRFREYGRIIPKENLHITLLFMGEADPTAMPTTIEFEPAKVRLEGTGAFPSLRYQRVLWIGAHGLEAMAKAVMDAVGRHDSFKGHLTFLRPRRHVPEKIILGNQWPATDFRAEEILLMRSVLKPGGAEYSVIRRFQSSQ